MICQWLDELDHALIFADIPDHEELPPYSGAFKKYISKVSANYFYGKRDYRISFEAIFVCIIEVLIPVHHKVRLPSQIKARLIGFFSKIDQRYKRLRFSLRALIDFFSKLESHYEYKTCFESPVDFIPGVAKIHRIWVGKNPGRDAIVQMAATNLHIASKWFQCPCQSILWTDNPTLLNLPSDTPGLSHFTVKSLDSLYSNDNSYTSNLINRLVTHCKVLSRWREFAMVSDLLRQAVLIKYGGLYIDATWQLPIQMSNCHIPMLKPTSSDVYLAYIYNTDGNFVDADNASNFTSRKVSYSKYLQEENDSHFDTHAEKMNKSIMYIGQPNHGLPIRIAENILAFFDHNKAPLLAAAERNYRTFKHQRLLQYAINGEDYAPTEHDVAFVGWLDQIPFQKALFDMEMYQTSVSSEGVFFEYKYPKALWMSCKSDALYQYRASFGLAKRWSLTWKRADMKDLPYVEYP